MTSRPRVAVIQFPGSNCEFETAAVLDQAGIEAHVFRWNRNPDELNDFLGFVIPGGFSYQDRIRAGAVAAKKKIMKRIIQASETGKPVLGICNGAQILVETGMVPGLTHDKIEMALASNRVEQTSGYYCEWVYLTPAADGARTAFSRHFKPNQIIPLPVAHAEGRFVSSDAKVMETIRSNNQVGFRYCTSDGKIVMDYPVNPNGAADNIAGLYNKTGNVLALMPHPERASWIRQVPLDITSAYSGFRKQARRNLSENRQPGPGFAFFTSMRDYILEKIQ